MVQYRADWIVPISDSPIRNGWVAVEQGRIAGVGRSRATDAAAPDEERDLGSVAILPGLVNAHTHLELSYLRDDIAPASDFTSWIRSVVRKRRERANPESVEIMDAVDEAIRESLACGTAVVGDISNTLVTVSRLAESPLRAVVFFELIRFSGSDADGFVEQACRRLDQLPSRGAVRVSLAAHAPYSVGPLVFRAIREQLDRRPFLPSSVHLSESEEEVEFIEQGSGPWRRFLEEAGVWDDEWRAPGVSPVRYLTENGFMNRRLLVVHGVQMTSDDLSLVRDSGATLVTCPRSNGHTGAGAPPIADFYASGVRVAIGTDSLASSPDLNVFAELATMRALAPGVPSSRLLESATVEGARCLGFDGEFGTIEPGKYARLIAVDVPPDTTDVEEYLVSGVAPEQVRWIDEIED